MLVFVVSVLMSTPFTIYAKLKSFFDMPGDWDHILFCIEDLSQSGQV